MKNKKPQLFIIIGLFFYASIYIATSVDKAPLCGGINYAGLAKIQDTVSTINGFLSHQINGKQCDNFEIIFVKSTSQQYAAVGDSVCAFAKKVGFPLKSVVIITVDTVLMKRDTLSTTQCL